MLQKPGEQRPDNSCAMKRVLILILSTEMADVQGAGPPFHYKTLMETSRATWNAEEVEGVETVFYFGRSDKSSTDKILYTPVDDGFFDMGKKTLAAFEYALAHRRFDYIFRGNASLYINKAGLLRYAQNQPETNLALGVLAPGEHGTEFMWGPGYMLSRDVVQKVVDNQQFWDHRDMDDVAISNLLRGIDVPLDNRGSLVSLAIKGEGRQCIFYENGSGGAAYAQTMKEVVAAAPNQFAFRVKTDHDRETDVRLMTELHEAFNL